MMRSMYAGVAGLKTHQTKMDVIGNNVANVNTVAYKSSSITFSELMYQTTQKSSGPNATTGTGGTNARQIGLGVKSAAISTSISTQGATQTTGNPFDICITGDSFFVVSDGSDNMFTRAGAFNVDANGNLVMSSNGYNVMGWGVDPDTNSIKEDTVEPLRIMSPENMTFEPEATSQAYVSGIMDKNDEDAATDAGRTLSLSFYDNLGYSYTAKFSVHSTTEGGSYYVKLDDILSKGTDGKMHSILENYPTGTVLTDIVNLKTADSTTAFTVNVAVPKSKKSDANMASDGDGITWTDTEANKTYKVNFPAYDEANPSKNPVIALKGDVVSSYSYDLDDTTNPISDEQKEAIKKIYGFTDEEFDMIHTFEIDKATGQMTITRKDVSDAALLEYDTNNGYFSTIGGGKAITLDFNPSFEKAGTTYTLEQFKDINFDWSTTNMYNNSGTSTISAVNGDTNGNFTGRKLGNMSGVTIQTNGMIYASYDNGMTRLLGQIAVAQFSNSAGLEKVGDNLYSASLNSGAFDGVGVDITTTGGYMTTGVLEMSNVDLSSEFTEMITTQRGFQANSRIITVSDTMLEELVNLKR